MRGSLGDFFFFPAPNARIDYRERIYTRRAISPPMKISRRARLDGTTSPSVIDEGTDGQKIKFLTDTE